MLLGIPRLIVDETKTVKTAVDKWEKRVVTGSDRTRGWSWLGRQRAALRDSPLSMGGSCNSFPGGDSSLCSSFPVLAPVELQKLQVGVI